MPTNHQYIHHGWRKFQNIMISNAYKSSIYPPWLEKISKYTDFKCLKIINLSTMVWENIEIYWFQMPTNHQFIHHGCSKCWHLLITNAYKSSFIHHGWRKYWNLQITNAFKSSIYPPWLEKISKYTDFKCLKFINLSTMVGENFKIYWSYHTC